MAAQAVEGGHLTDKQRGRFHRRLDELIRQMSIGSCPYGVAMYKLQRIIDGPSDDTICVDRSAQIDPAVAFGAGWTIDEQDDAARQITELNVSNIKCILLESEMDVDRDKGIVNGEEAHVSLVRTSYIRLDAAILLRLIANQKLIPERWRSDHSVLFNGTILYSPDSARMVPQLRWNDHRNQWEVVPILLNTGLSRYTKVAVLAPS